MAYGYNPYGGYGMQTAGYPQVTQPQQTYAPQVGVMSQMTPQQPNATLRLVTSRDEATTAQIPFDNTINVFVNLSAGEVYIKRFNPNTGGAVFTDYLDAQRAQEALIAAQEAAKPPVQYATVEQLTGLEQRVSELAEAVAARRTRGAKTDE